ncbi:hypothetical protein BCR39DRAFT_540559 [Naematelia encephala]|uniref:Mitochondrial ribosomal protein subunit L20-domain-containing protein n=1 Tax=Naematelia encephala TaxID=71784 RepID=A0A1Y2AW83_9TREE|nr:hypothetical protein BCR39DRAFT_540559 [Naematelia encephala]
MASLASSSRLGLTSSPFTPLGSLRLKHGGNLRWQKNRPKPPRIPKLYSPHTPKPILPSSGTSQPHPPHLLAPDDYVPPTTASPLENGMTFHHSPPPSAPSYTTGVVPPMLKWLGGESIRLSGEEAAPLLRHRKEPIAGKIHQWGEETVARMKELRAQGMSTKSVVEQLGLTEEDRVLVARVAPLSKEQQAVKEAELQETKDLWGYRKRLARESRVVRRTYW